MASTETGLRTVTQVLRGEPTLEGEGFLVHRPFPSWALSQFDPFLLLDEMGPMDLKPGEAKGAPDHPHRGFETVTYMLAGRFEHHDSAGHAGKLLPGDVQWMTAGGGVIHSEMPEEEFAVSGGRMHGVQLWVNLPRVDKMMPPRYQEIPGSSIPVGKSSDGLATVRVIAGESLGQRAVIETRTPIFYLHFKLLPGGKIEQSVPEDFNVFAYVLEGSGQFGRDGIATSRGNMVMFAKDGTVVSAEAPKTSDATLEFLLIGGQPLNEPVARYGPFVMNTKEEIGQAMEDYSRGVLGKIVR